MEEIILIIMIIIMSLGTTIRIKENIQFIIERKQALKIPLVSAIFYPISSMLYLFMTSLSIDKYYDVIYNDITMPIHVYIFFIAPSIIVITSIIAIIKAKKNKIKIITKNAYLIASTFLISVWLMPLIDICWFLSDSYKERIKKYN